MNPAVVLPTHPRLLFACLLALVLCPGVVRAGTGRMAVAGWAEPEGGARVTGSPAPEALVRRAALEASWGRIHPEEGATVEYRGAARGAAALAAGCSCAVSMPVRIRKAGRVTVETTVRIRVDNVPQERSEPARLLFSNAPESFRGPGLLFQGVAEPGQGTRLFFHHDNHAGRPLRVFVHVTNPGSEPVECLVASGVAGPHADPTLAGHRAVLRFLDAFKSGAGLVRVIRPGTAAVLVELETRPKQAVSGVLDLRLLGGGPLVCQVRAEERLALPVADGALVAAAQGAAHVYQPAHKRVAASYTVGQPWTFVDMGRSPVSSVDGQRQLAGNYGVMYTTEMELVNPTLEEQTVVLSLSPRGGFAWGAFLVGENVVEAGPGAPPREFRIAAVRLAPREIRRITVSSLPAGGSFYPVWLLARSTAPGTEPEKASYPGGGYPAYYDSGDTWLPQGGGPS